MIKPHFLAALVAAFLMPIIIFPVKVNAMTEEEYANAIYEQFLEQWQEQYDAQLAEQIAALEDDVSVTDQEFEELCMVGMNEAGNQGTQGIRYVISCILNRVEDPRFPSTIHDVIYQPNQFSTHHKFTPTEEVREAVRLELKERSDYGIKWFCSAGGYNYYGTPAFKYGGHWFSR